MAFADRIAFEQLSTELNKARQELNELYELFDRKKLADNLRKYACFNNTCSKYFFRKVRGVAGALRYIFPHENPTAEPVTTDPEILAHCAMFYDNLYGRSFVPYYALCNFSDIPLSVRLDDDDRESIDEDITIENLRQALDKNEKRISPGYGWTHGTLLPHLLDSDR